MAVNQKLIDRLLKRSEEDKKIEIGLEGLADTPFYVKLTKEEFKQAKKEAKEGLDPENPAHEDIYRNRLDALIVAASLYDHNEEKVFSGALYEALDIDFDPIKAVGKFIEYAEEQVINAAALECIGFISKEKAQKDNEAAKN